MTRWINTLVLFLIACSAGMAQNTDAVYQIQRHDLPSSVQPGQRIMGHLYLKCVSPGSPRAYLPMLKAVGGEVDFTPPGDRLIPWYYSESAAVRDGKLEQAFTLDVPLNVPQGEAQLTFSIKSDNGQPAKLQDASGKSMGNAFIWKCKVGSADAMPLVVGKMSPPKLDGRVEAAEWSGAGKIPAFVNNSDGTPTAASTSMMIGHDDKSVYIAVVCQEPDMSKAKAAEMPGRDPNNYLNESIELFMNPKADRASYYHFIADIIGQKYDALGSDCYGYNPEWQVASYKGNDFWSMEIAIPFTAFAASTPAPGDAWLANFARERHAGVSDLYAWKATHGSLNGTGAFSPMVFDSLKVYLQRSGKKLADEANLWPANVKTSAEDWLTELSAWQARLNGLDTVDDSNYGGLASTLDGLEKGIEPYRMKALSSLSGGSPFYITRSWPYEIFTGKNSEIDSKLANINVTLLKDEWVDVALNVTNLTDKTMAVRFSTRHGKEGEFDKLGLIGLDTLWQEAVPVASKDGKPAWDAIQPIQAGVFEIPAGVTKQIWLSIHVPKDYNGSNVISGNMKVEAVDGTPGKSMMVPITVNTLPQLLTKNPPVHGFAWNQLNPELLNESPQWVQAHYADLKSHGIDTCMLHNLSTLPRPKAKADGTLEKMDFTNMDRILEATKGQFASYYMSLDVWEKSWVRKDLFGLEFPSPSYEKAFKNWLKALVGRLKKHGIGYDRFVVNPYDESVSDNCYFIAKWIKETDPKIRTVLDSIGPVATIKKFAEYNDLWVPHFNSYQAEENGPSIDEMRKEGKELWVYWYSEGGNEKQQDPTRHYMYKYWWAFKNDVTGVAYWAQQYYGDPWNRAETDRIYETSLVYPTEAGCIPSRRWQAWRQGFQDYCLLSQAKHELKSRGDAKGLAELSRLVDKAIQSPSDPTNFDAARAFSKQALGVK